MKRLLAAMSGGVDSSVAAALAVRDGFEVTGVTLKQWEHPDEETRLAKGCCTLDAVDDARRAAALIGIPHYVFDFRDVFRREVVEPWVAEYAAGRTPNPCVRCNELVRFGALLDKALRLGFDGLVTGHYARVLEGRLYRARDRSKDQSYVLHALAAPALDRVWFPLGEFSSKASVREVARSLGLPNADREDSVEVCFVGEGRRPGDVVGDFVPDAVRPGPIVDAGGSVLGEHRGLAHYTVGQRRGLGVVAARPRYVSALNPSLNAVVVADRESLGSLRVEAARPRFAHGTPADGAVVGAVVRYRGEEVEARYEGRPDGFVLDLDRPVIAAPGQAVVLYDGDMVLGGGTIDRSAGLV